MARNLHAHAWKVSTVNTSPKRSALISALLHAAAILLVLAATSVKPPAQIPSRVFLIAPNDVAPLAAPHRANTGGGGGQRDTRPASQGDIARRATREFVAPTPVALNDHAQITIEPAILGDPAPRTFDFAQLGIPNGVAGPPSGGPGKNGGIGNGGDGGGQGDQHGPGYGAGDKPGADGGIPQSTAGHLTAPVLIYKSEPEYSEEGRRAKIQGTVMLRIEIDEHGLPRAVSIRQGLGLGLDEKAIQAVTRWRFRPATRNGKPIPSTAMVEVFFRLL